MKGPQPALRQVAVLSLLWALTSTGKLKLFKLVNLKYNT